MAWHGNGKEKFNFENPQVAIVHYAGELSLVEYGENEILGSVRTSYTNSHVLSVRVNENKNLNDNDRYGIDDRTAPAKRIAFLLDAQTASIRDLLSNVTVTINHDSKIDWLELNTRANLLLFRDKRRHLHLYDTDTQIRTQLLNFCTYVQWVPGSDVVVAQNRNSLCVWYNIHAPGQVTTHTIKGDVEDIERSGGKTEVIVDEGMSQAVYPLDESLIDFGTAIDDKDYVRAVDILDDLEVTPEVEAMWSQLSTEAVSVGDLRIAQRCAAALGNVAMSTYLGKAKEIKMQAEKDLGFRGMDIIIIIIIIMMIIIITTTNLHRHVLTHINISLSSSQSPFTISPSL